MKAVVYKGPFAVAVEERPDPRIEEPTDAIVKTTTTNICGSDLHMYEGRDEVDEGMVLGNCAEGFPNYCLRTNPTDGVDGAAYGYSQMGPYQGGQADPDAGRANPSFIVSHDLSLDDAVDAYDKFDKRLDGYSKLLLHPAA